MFTYREDQSDEVSMAYIYRERESNIRWKENDMKQQASFYGIVICNEIIIIFAVIILIVHMV